MPLRGGRIGVLQATIRPNASHHAVIEQVHADLKNSALAHLPSGVFTANAAWLVLATIAFNLTRAAGTLAAPDLARATTTTIRRKLITVPAHTGDFSASSCTFRPAGPGKPPRRHCSTGSTIYRPPTRPD